MNGTFSIDDEGYPRAVFAPEYELLAAFLADTHCGTIARCDELLKTMEAVREGELQDWDGGYGDSIAIEIRRDGAEIETEFTEPPSRLIVPLDDLEEAIVAWRALLATRNR